MSAKKFNEDWQNGQTAAGKRLPALQRKYESVLWANAKKTANRYSSMTAAAEPNADPSAIMDEAGLKVAITARTAAERKRMAKLVADSLIGTTKPDFYDAILTSLGASQAEEATKAVRDGLNQAIADSLTEGWTVPETATKIEETLTDYATWEATRLARTDLVGISNSISLKAAQSLGDQAPTFKRWLSAGDELVRESHQEADSQTVEVGKPFSVGGFPMDHPGDWLAPAEERMNCRCVSVYLDDANASLAHSFEGGIVEDPIATASDDIQESLAAAAVDFSSGSMIALYPENPGSLVVEGGQDEASLHVTLCFLPEGVDGEREMLLTWLGTIAEETPFLEGEVGGMGYFAPGEDGMPVIALPDVVGLNELRTRIAGAVGLSETTYATSHGFLPHITLEYVEDASAETPDVTGTQLRFPTLSLVEGESRTDFPFLPGNEGMMAAAFTQKQRDTLAEEGVAMKDGSFPVRNRADLSNAIASLGRAKDVAAAKRHIAKRARALDALDGLPESWGITAAGISVLEDETDPWYEDQRDEAAVSPLVAERERLFKGNLGQNRRFGTAIPTEYDSIQAARAAGLTGLNASSAPLAPPDEWFDDPGFDGPTPLTVTADGRVMGHLGEWGKCHTGIGGRCVMIPRSRTGYADFHNGGLVTASGKEIRVGKLTLDTGHAPLQAGASRAAAHYDHTGHVGAFVRAGEDQFGPWLAGAVRSDATPEQIRDLRANPPSGDWRKLHGRDSLELIAALAVPIQGFPVAALAASGEITAFVSGWSDEGDLALVASADPEELEREWQLLEERVGLTAANPYHDDSGRFDTGGAQEPLPQKELDRETALGAYGDHGFREGERVRTAEGHLGTVKSGETYSGSQVPVEREMDGIVEHHDPETLRREGPRAALPPREPIVASSDRELDLLIARLDGMDGLAALIAAPLSEEDLVREMALIAARLDGMDGLAALVEPPAPEAVDEPKTITIENADGGVINVYLGESETDEMDIGDDVLDAEIAYQIDFFDNYGYWPAGAQSGADLSDAQMARVKMLAPLMISDPAAPTSVAIRGRLVRKGLLYSLGA